VRDRNVYVGYGLSRRHEQAASIETQPTMITQDVQGLKVLGMRSRSRQLACCGRLFPKRCLMLYLSARSVFFFTRICLCEMCVRGSYRFDALAA
jgi:hypothetical protein